MSWDHLPQSLYCRSNAVCCKIVLKDLTAVERDKCRKCFLVLVILVFVFCLFLFFFYFPNFVAVLCRELFNSSRVITETGVGG